MTVPLRVRSNYSLLYGGSRLDELLDAAAALGHDTLALADRNAMYGAIHYYTAARQCGIRPILGVELTDRAEREAILILARNLDGYRTLCRLVTARNLDPAFDLASAVRTCHDSVIAIALTAGMVPRLRGGLARDALFAGIACYGDRRNRLQTEGLMRAARQFKVPLAAVPEMAFHEPGRHRLHRILRTIGLGTLAGRVPAHRLAHPAAFIKSAGQMAADYAEWPEALAATRRIAEACRLDLPLGRPIFPSFPLPCGASAGAYLSRLATDGLERRHGSLRPDALRRLCYELDIIDRLGFSPYFLIVHDIAEFARRERIPMVARGSAAGSLVVYALGLSNVDPLEYDLYFERFLNLSRTDCPDVDLDFSWRRRDEVIDYIYRRWGDDHVAMISTHATLQPRSAFREVARAAGMPLEEVGRLSKRLPHYREGTLRETIAARPECRGFPLERPGMATILDAAEALDGFPRHLSVHVGGVVIADRPLTDYVPLERSAKGVVITQYEKDAIEKLGLVKMDILAQRSLAIVEDTCRMVEDNHGVRVDPTDVPDGDAATAEVLRRGRTLGCFQIESPGMRNLLKMMRAENKLDVIHGLSLIRPGPASSGMKDRFVRRRRGQEAVTHLDRRLGELLSQTHGIMLYQEDVLKVAHHLAGFSLDRADELRKVMTKNRSSARMKTLCRAFLEGVVERGGSPDAAGELWEQVANFAGYSYCKAHACTYGQISYAATYLKAHWPAEFLAAVIANAAGYYEPRVYLEEARRLGVTVAGPDVNESRAECLAQRPAPGGPVVLRLGLRHVRSLSQRHLAAILEGRDHGPYRSLPDLSLRVGLARDEIENLVLAGALDGFGPNRPQLLWQLIRVLKRRSSHDHATTATLFDEDVHTPPPVASETLPPLPDYSLAERLAHEEAMLGMTPSAHPMTALRPMIRTGEAAPIARLASRDAADDDEVTVAGIVVAARSARTAKGEMMKFISIEDETGIIECVLFPDAYRRFGHVLTSGGPYLVTGPLEDHLGARTLTAEHLCEAREADPVAAGTAVPHCPVQQPS